MPVVDWIVNDVIRTGSAVAQTGSDVIITNLTVDAEKFTAKVLHLTGNDKMTKTSV